MDSKSRIQRRSEAKKSFNFEPDVRRMFGRWKRANPNVIEARMFNESLRAHLRGFKSTKKEGEAAA